MHSRKTLISLLLMLVACWGCSDTPSGAPAAETPTAPAWFEEIGAANGLIFNHVSGHDDQHLFPEILGGGAALFDMDGDGDLDVYLVQSGDVRNPGSPAGENRLFRNDGDARFTDVTAASGAGDLGYGMGVVVGDYDNDGDPDLYVTNFGPNVLLRNDGNGKFTDVTDRAGVGHAGWSTSGAFLDYDNDGDLDLFVVNYVNWSIGIEQACYNRSGLHDYCLPTNYLAPGTDTFYRNEGDGRFADVTEVAGFHTAFGNGLGVTTGDFDRNGFQDLFVANDTTVNQLWLNQDGTRFVDESLLRGCAMDEHGTAKAGMGVAVADIDDDGDDDILVANLRGQTDSMFRNENGIFRDVTGNVGLGQTSRWYTRFGIGLVDFDNDGYLDLFEANGRVEASAEPETDDVYAEPNALFRGLPGGRFEHILPQGGTAAPLMGTSRAAVFGDVDGDGGVDVLVVNRDGAAHLLRNIAPGRGNWVALRVLDRHGRDALGATVRVTLGERVVTRDVRAAYSYCASNDPKIHIGLGTATQIDGVEIRWIDGTTERFGTIEAGATTTLQRGRGS